MRYLYKGAQRKGPGRKRKYDGKVSWKGIDKRRFRLCYEDDDLRAYEAVLWSVTMKQKLKVVYVKAKEGEGYKILVCTDTDMKGQQVLRYYRLRFQTSIFDQGCQNTYRHRALPGQKRAQTV